MALGDLPVNWVGVALMVFAMVLFYLEVQAPGIGIFGVSGTIAFLVGGFLLVGGLTPPAIPQAPDAPTFRVNYFLLGGIAAAILGLMLFVAKDVARAREARVRGPELDHADHRPGGRRDGDAGPAGLRPRGRRGVDRRQRFRRPYREGRRGDSIGGRGPYAEGSSGRPKLSAIVSL